MIEAPPLLTIKRPSRRPTHDQIAAFKGFPTAIVSDAMDGGGALSSTIRHIDGGRDLPPSAAGPALTVGCGPADILALLASLRFVHDGDIVVSAFDGHQARAQLGDRVAQFMKNGGATGFVTDGPARDIDGILPVGLPIWCTGLTPASPFENGPGTVGLPIQIGGQTVESGDMIVADRDGVVVVPFDRIDDVAARSTETLALENDLEAQRTTGKSMPETVDQILASDRVRWIE